jgi:hypothetical protein
VNRPLLDLKYQTNWSLCSYSHVCFLPLMKFTHNHYHTRSRRHLLCLTHLAWAALWNSSCASRLSTAASHPGSAQCRRCHHHPLLQQPELHSLRYYAAEKVLSPSSGMVAGAGGEPAPGAGLAQMPLCRRGAETSSKATWHCPGRQMEADAPAALPLLHLHLLTASTCQSQ